MAVKHCVSYNRQPYYSSGRTASPRRSFCMLSPRRFQQLDRTPSHQVTITQASARKLPDTLLCIPIFRTFKGVYSVLEPPTPQLIQNLIGLFKRYSFPAQQCTSYSLKSSNIQTPQNSPLQVFTVNPSFTPRPNCGIPASGSLEFIASGTNSGVVGAGSVGFGVARKLFGVGLLGLSS